MRPTGPADPAAPVGPVNPTGPVLPLAPGGPVAPVLPGKHVAHCNCNRGSMTRQLSCLRLTLVTLSKMTAGVSYYRLFWAHRKNTCHIKILIHNIEN